MVSVCTHTVANLTAKLGSGGQQQFPTVWVMFAGITTASPMIRAATRQVTGHFTVLVGDHASGSEAQLAASEVCTGTMSALANTGRAPVADQSDCRFVYRPSEAGQSKSPVFKTNGLDAISVFALVLKRIGLKTHCETAIGHVLRVSEEQQAQVYAATYPHTKARTDPEHPDFKGANLELRIRLKKPNQPADMAATVKTEVKHD